MLPYLRMECLHTLFVIFLHKKFLSYPLFVYSVIYLYQYGLWVLINTILFYCSNGPALDIGSSCSWPTIPLTHSYQCRLLFLFSFSFFSSSFFLVLEDAPGSCVFPLPVLKSVISPKSLFTGEQCRKPGSEHCFCCFLHQLLLFLPTTTYSHLLSEYHSLPITHYPNLSAILVSCTALEILSLGNLNISFLISDIGLLWEFKFQLSNVHVLADSAQQIVP